MTEAEKSKRLDDFTAYMISCFGVRWHTVCPYGKIKLMKQCYYDGYKEAMK